MCDSCGADAAVLLAPRHAHERWAGRLHLVPSGDSDPQWRCSPCLAAALETTSWCALGVGGPHSDPRRTGVLVAHARGGADAWAQLCGLLAAVPERLLVSVAMRIDAAPEPWLVLWRFADGAFAERFFDTLPAAVTALSEGLEGIVAAETAAGY